jgi:hypothetical protein
MHRLQCSVLCQIVLSGYPGVPTLALTSNWMLGSVWSLGFVHALGTLLVVICCSYAYVRSLASRGGLTVLSLLTCLALSCSTLCCVLHAVCAVQLCMECCRTRYLHSSTCCRSHSVKSHGSCSAVVVVWCCLSHSSLHVGQYVFQVVKACCISMMVICCIYLTAA